MTTPRPDKRAALEKLRGFQRSTVEHVVKRLFDTRGSQRFLVADEVGLGKTLVARGVIAEFIDHHWDHRRIDIVYVCSNQALARENLRKLRTVGDDFSKEIAATRLTLLARTPNEAQRLHNRLNFISLTPGTAIRTSGTGIREERQVLYHLMRELPGDFGDKAWLKNFLRGYVETERWRGLLKAQLDLDETLAARFQTSLLARKDLVSELDVMREAFRRHDSHAAQASSVRAVQLIGKLRALLAHVCIDALEPDLIILDEFQRFKDLLSTSDEVSQEAEVAKQLFNYRTSEGSRVALLLLSATPYRMFTTSDEVATEDHHADFLETTKFLFDDQTRTRQLSTTLEQYREQLKRATLGKPHEISRIRDSLQSQLLTIMSRRERVSSTSERDAMVTEPRLPTQISERDIAQYIALARLGDRLECRDLTELWKSAPYLLNFAKTYEFKRTLKDKRREKALRQALAEAAADHLSEDQLKDYAALDPSNARLRALSEAAIEADRWRMLWLPPSLPYWPLSGPWANNEHFTKKLLFSSWNVVPDAVSAMLSYEVERRMVGAAAQKREIPYPDFYRKRRGLLRFPVRGGKPSAMNTLALQLPCLGLSDVHPLSLTGDDTRREVRERVEPMVAQLAERWVSSDTADDQWYWAALLLLDDPHEVTTLLEAITSDEDVVDDEPLKEELDLSESDAEGRRRGNTGLSTHARRALAVLGGEVRLGAFPPELVDVLVDHALGNPAILWARSLSGFGVEPTKRRQLGFAFANSMRSLFNEPPVIEMLRDADDDAYWRRALRYAVDGNLQAVLDEYAHQLWESEDWSGDAREAVAERITEAACGALTTKTSRVGPDYIHSDGSALKENGTTMRTHFALRYGSLRSSGEASEIREDAVRDAFKSPFYPFVLASTSVGQEGLDFHPWCHEVWHWNLPGNPVDLEQREGRVHRYKGHAVRKNIAEMHGNALRAEWSPGKDPWEILFEHAEKAARAENAPELVPCWVSSGSTKVRRCVPMLPFSKELDQLDALKRSLAIYRVVFGQPRQEELLKLLHAGDISIEEMESWAIRLEVEPEETST